MQLRMTGKRTTPPDAGEKAGAPGQGPAAAPPPPGPPEAGRPAGAPAPVEPDRPPAQTVVPVGGSDGRIEALAQRIAEMGDRVEGLVSGLDAIRQETVGVGQKVRDGEEKFLRLLGLLEGSPGSENPFAEPVEGPAERERPRGAFAPPPTYTPALEPSPATHPAASTALAFTLPRAEAGDRLLGSLGSSGPTWPGGMEHALAGLEESVLLLEWCDMLLETVDRSGLGHLLDWYQSLGWIDERLKDRLLAYAQGIHAPAEEDPYKASEAANPARREGVQAPPAWRQDLELHLRSLAFAARLRGDGSPERLKEALRKAVGIRAP